MNQRGWNFETYFCFVLQYLPQDCTRSNGLNRKCRKIVLTDGGDRSWEMDLKFKKNLGCFSIIRGWRHFCDENGKKAGSFFVFELTIKEGTPLLYFSPSESTINYTKLPTQKRFVTVRVVPDCLKRCRLVSFFSSNKNSCWFYCNIVFFLFNSPFKIFFSISQGDS